MKVAFFGTPHYSLLVLEPLYNAGHTITCVVTKPHLPVGRKQIPTPTAVAVWAGQKQIPILTPPSSKDKPWVFSDESQVTREILNYRPDVLITADYTQKIPINLIRQIKYGGINVHPSLLPSYRGPAPVPWAILNGESETGVSIITLTEKFDQGQIVAQEKEIILPSDTTDSLLTKLFTKGGEMLVNVIPAYCHAVLVLRYTQDPELVEWVSASPYNSHKIPKQVRDDNSNLQSSYYPRLTRDDGFVPWELVKTALAGETVPFLTMQQNNNVTIIKALTKKQGDEASQTSIAEIIFRTFRALHPWPGLWTKVIIDTFEKRLKILRVHLASFTNQPRLILDEVQLESKQPITGNALHDLLNKINLS